MTKHDIQGTFVVLSNVISLSQCREWMVSTLDGKFMSSHIDGSECVIAVASHYVM